MKVNKRMAVRGGAALASLLGLTTAVSFVVTDANKSGTIATEEGYRISFTGGTQTNSLAVTGLSESTPAYKTISIDWLFSKNVGDGTVKATLALNNKVSSTHAITVYVAGAEWGVEDPATLATITTTDSSKTIDLGSVNNESKKGTKSLYLKFTLAQTGSQASETTATLLGSLDVTLSYVASGSAA